MTKIVKVLLFIYRVKRNQPEFFILHRQKGDYVVLTGHVELNENLEDAAKREIIEEIGVTPLKIFNLNHSVEVNLPQGLSKEHAILIEIPPNIDPHYLPSNEMNLWVGLAQLSHLLTYDNQKSFLPYIAEYFNRPSLT